LAERVTFGEVDRQGLRAHYEAADVVVFPVEWEEPFGLVPLEAMASGTPVVATGLGGSGEFLVDGYNCLLVPPGRPEQLAAAVRRLAGDPELRYRLRQGGEATAAELTVDRLAAVLEEWHRAAAERFANGRPLDRTLSLPVSPLPVVHPLARHQAEAPATLASGDPAAIKRLYWDLGGYWEETHAEDLSGIPLLSRPETHPVVVQMLEGIRGLVLDAGCGPRASLSVALAVAPERTVVALDMGLGTVRLARAGAAAGAVALLGVVGDVEQLPFRDEAFDGVVCDDTLEHLPDDVSGVSELGRVLGRRGRMVLATPNRHSAVVMKQKLFDLLRGRRHPAAHYFVSNSHIREYSWSEFETLVRPVLQVRRRAGVGWDDSRKRRIFSRFVGREPVRRVGQMIVLEVGRPDGTDRTSPP
jgi:SAM-dependent methyltransferase